MKNKSFLPFFVLFSVLTILSCKEKYDPAGDELRMRKKADSLYWLAERSYRSKDLIKTDDLCNEVISGYTSFDPQVFVLKGMVQMELENYSRAIELFTNAIDEPDMQHYVLEHIYQKRATCKEKLKDYRGALIDYDFLINSYNNGYNYYHRGLIKYNFLNDEDGACSDWSIAGEKGYNRAYKLINEFCNN